MGAVVSLEEALADRRVFRGGQPLARDQGATPSGFAALDEALPWGGFPRGALTEILLPAPGLGELELLSQAWARIGEKERLAFVAPPCIPYAPALLRAKWPLARFAWIEAPAAQAAWAAEQCLRAGCLGAIAFWLDRCDDKNLRRLQLAAEEGSVHAFLFRPLRHAANASPAALRLVIESKPGALNVRVLKVRGAVAPARVLQRERLETPTPVKDTHDFFLAEEAPAVRTVSTPRDAQRLRDGVRTRVARHPPPIATSPCAEEIVPPANVPLARVVYDASNARTVRAYRTLRALLATRNLRATASARRAPVV